MGSQTFKQIGEGENADRAFADAVEQAKYDYGHAGYTGTLAEKYEFTVVSEPLPYSAACDLAEQMIDNNDPLIDDKWGPAGCIPIDDGKKVSRRFLFFGWASS